MLLSCKDFDLYLGYGSAWCGHLTVTQEKQVGSNPIGAAKYLFFEHKLCEKRTFGFSKIDSVTQLVEYHTFNVRVMGSSPIGVTNIFNMVTLAE